MAGKRWVKNFTEIALSRMVKEIEANLCFSIFGKNSKIQNGRHFWGEEYFFLNWQEYIFKIPCGSEILTISLYLARLIQNGCHFWGKENFFEN